MALKAPERSSSAAGCRAVWGTGKPHHQGGLAIVVGIALALPAVAHAFFLDEARNFEIRGRFYSEAALAAESSQPQTRPGRAPLQLIEQRNFVNPEFEARLTPYQPFSLDDFSFRLALWGFYDGIYDYGTPQYNRARQNIQGRISQGHLLSQPVTHTDTLTDSRKMYTYQPDPVLGHYNNPGHYSDIPFRFNEAYLNFAKGPLFLRMGRQTISWGESDTVALLDANNPFNQTMAIPGVFQDVDEARIPLWTARANLSLFDSWGPISSAFAETYLVPGSIDTTVSQVPMPLASPYSPPQGDPQSLIAGLIPPDVAQGLVDTALGGIRLGLFDHLPTRTMNHSRYGLRLGGIVAQNYTTNVWYYRTFATQPVPRFLPPDLSRSPLVAGAGATGPTQIITELHHGMVDVYGASTSFFSEHLNGVVRSEVEYFVNEPAFIPNQNIPFENLLREPHLRNLVNQIPGNHVSKGSDQGSIPHADMFRFELGFDRFFFFRPLNPSNSFTWVTAYVGQWNLSETFGSQNYRFGGQQKATSTGTKVGANTAGLSINNISQLHTVATDFVDLYSYESFLQTHLETTYMHGRLSPAITAVIGLNGTYVFPMGITYRFTDNLLFDLKYVLTGGNFMFPTGYFKDRSQVGARITALLN